MVRVLKFGRTPKRVINIGTTAQTEKSLTNKYFASLYGSVICTLHFRFLLWASSRLTNGNEFDWNIQHFLFAGTKIFILKCKGFGTVILWLERAGWSAGDGLSLSHAGMDFGSGRGGNEWKILCF